MEQDSTYMKKPLNYHGFAFDEFFKADKRQARWTKERREFGFDSTELWGLEYTIAAFILPRLKQFAAAPGGHPGSLTYEEWKDLLNEMVVAFEILVRDDDTTPEEDAKIERGLTLFAKWYRHLWT